MSRDRQLHLGAFMRPVGIHTAWWRYPGGYPDANFNFAHMARFAQTPGGGEVRRVLHGRPSGAAEHADGGAAAQSATVTSFDPLTLLPALAVLTERIGLIATASTTYNEPYHVARKFASLDHIANGRAGWNLVTIAQPGRGPEFRPRGACRARRRATPGPASSSTW